LKAPGEVFGATLAVAAGLAVVVFFSAIAWFLPALKN
jgi:hypothetical protein